MKGFLTRTIGDRLSGPRDDRRLLTLIYHRVLDVFDPLRPDEVTRDLFEWQMELLASRFSVLPLPEALEKMRTGSLPGRAIAITFDDGYRDNLTNALPILQKYGLHATFFIAAGFLDGGRMWNDTVIELLAAWKGHTLDLGGIGLGDYDLSSVEKRVRARNQLIKKLKYLPLAERGEYIERLASLDVDLPDDLMLGSNQLQDLVAAGMGIGGHTVQHPILSRLPREQAREEICAGREMLENILSQPVEIFAYPNGKRDTDYSEESIDLVRECGFRHAFSTNWGVATKATDGFQLPRFTPWDRTPDRFTLRLLQMFRKPTGNGPG